MATNAKQLHTRRTGRTGRAGLSGKVGGWSNITLYSLHDLGEIPLLAVGQFGAQVEQAWCSSARPSHCTSDGRIPIYAREARPHLRWHDGPCATWRCAFFLAAATGKRASPNFSPLWNNRDRTYRPFNLSALMSVINDRRTYLPRNRPTLGGGRGRQGVHRNALFRSLRYQRRNDAIPARSIIGVAWRFAAAGITDM